MPHGPGLDAPARLTVRSPAPTWQVEGWVIGRSLYSVRVAWREPSGIAAEGWFVWQPGDRFHGKQRGVSEQFALRVE